MGPRAQGLRAQRPVKRVTPPVQAPFAPSVKPVPEAVAGLDSKTGKPILLHTCATVVVTHGPVSSLTAPGARFLEMQRAFAGVPRRCKSPPKYGVDAEKAAAAAKANHDKRVSAGNKAAVDRRSDRFLIEAKDGDMQVVRECLRDLGDMTVSVGDEVACTGWGGTIWYIGTVCGQEKKGKKVVWRVYFGGDHSHSPMPLAPSRYGQATPNEVQPGTVQSWKAGWMFCVPVDSELQARAAPAHNHVNLD